MRTARLAAVACTVSVLLASCAQSSSPADGDASRAGGTLVSLSEIEQLAHLDPQRVYDTASGNIAISFLLRSLTMLDPTGDAPAGVVPDLATDIGRSNGDATEWQFTLREGATYEDGSAVTCEHVAYGVSRTFAQDVITDGPQFAVAFLDIPTLDDGSSAYKGPYDGTGQEHFDEAVSCDDRTITFRLRQPVGDFSQTVALPAFGPVKPDADTGEAYTDAPLSTGPYRIDTYDKGDRLVLVRNDAWDPDSDPYRPAYPDRVEVRFGLDASAIDEQIIADRGDARYAVQGINGVQAANLSRVFDDPALADRRLDVLDPYVLYAAINTAKVPVLEHRQAILAAMDRAAILTALGGSFAGEEGDGPVKPTLPDDYAPTGLWSELLGREVPPEGDPTLARELIDRSGEPMPSLVYDYPATEKGEAEAAAFVQGLTDAGIDITPNPIQGGLYYGTVLDPEQQNHLTWAGWGPDWANASTVLQPLFGAQGGFNLSRINQPVGLVDEQFQADLERGLRLTDRAEQGAAWQALNRRVAELALIAPTAFRRTQTIWGSGLGGVAWSDAWGTTPLVSVFVTADEDE